MHFIAQEINAKINRKTTAAATLELQQHQSGN
jgi:hypothetical protein